MNKIIIIIIAGIIALFLSCKKDDKEILKDEMNRAASSSLNIEIAQLKDKLNSAQSDFERAEILTEIAGIEAAKGDHVSSGKSSQNSVKFQPNRYKSHYLLGKAYCASGRYDDAEKELLTSIDLNNSFGPAHFEMGNVYYKKKNYSLAITEYNAAVTLEPGNHMAFNNLGVIYNLTGNKSQCIEAFTRAVKIKPDFASAYKNLGIIYDTVFRDRTAAINYYRTYLKLRPNCPERKLVKSWITGLGG